MAKFIHSILVPQAAIAADGQEDIDLPVNPLSAVLLHLAPLNETSTITNYAAWSLLFAAIENIRILHKGNSVINLTGGDLAAFLWMAHGCDIRQSGMVETDDDRRSIVVPIPFSRTFYDPNECFPETKRGELIMQIDWDVANTGYDGLRRSIETIELPEASPSHFQRLTTLTQTFAAVGPNDVDIPIGNILRGLLCFGTTGWAGATPAPTLGELRLLVDNKESHYSSTDYEVSRAISCLMGNRLTAYMDHYHSVNAAGVAREDTEDQQIACAKHELYTYLDLDPTRNDLYSLNTEGAGRVNLRVDAEAAEAVRVIPVELMDASDFLHT